jgi:prevent-host-death family protein
MPRPRKTEPTRRWKLEDAKARFSEVVRRAASDGPQMVTVRGAEAAVVVSAGDFERLSGSGEKVPLVDFLRGLDLGGLDLSRERDLGRDVEL